jgi:hypothetical protein
MNTVELTSLLKNNSVTGRYFCGVVPADSIFAEASRCKQMSKTAPYFLIANTDISGERGEHWLAFLFNKDGCLEVFDPYALAPWAYANMVKYFRARKGQCTIYNKMCVQSPLSNFCGLHCMFVVYYKCLNWKSSLKSVLLRNYLDDLSYNDCMVLKNVPTLYPALQTEHAGIINRMKKKSYFCE